MYVGILLIMMAAAAAIYGNSYTVRQKHKGTIQKCMFVESFLVFAWNFGYGVMSLCRETKYCYVFRDIALVGVMGFLLAELIFVRTVTDTMENGFWAMFTALLAIYIYSYVNLADPSVVKFFSHQGRMAYESAPCLGRTLEGIAFGTIFIIMLIMSIKWYRKSMSRRERRIIDMLLAAHFFLLFSCIPDTVMPMLGFVSFPSSGFGAFVCFMMDIFAADKLSAFELSSGSMNYFIYHKLESSVLFFKPDGELIECNEYASKFLNIDSEKKVKFSEIFRISDTEAKVLFVEKRDFSTEPASLYTRANNTPCNLVINTISDRYGEPMYTVCTVTDVSKEMHMYEELSELKGHLQDDLEKKTIEMESLALQSIATIANTIDAKDEYTKGHSERVAYYSCEIAKAMHWNDNDIANLHNAALLHDIGKIAVSDEVLKKPGQLDDDEYEEMKSHTIRGAEILADITMIPDIDAGAKYHHEHYDGTGYPQGLKGDEIPYIARIIGIADAFDAMNTKRVYRDALSKDEIIAKLHNCRGTQFDPEILDVFMKLYRGGKLETE